MDRHVATDRQALGPRLAHQLHAGRRRHPAQVHAATGLPHQFEYRVQCDRLGDHGNAREPEAAGHHPAMRDATAREPGVLRMQPHREAEGGRVLHRMHQGARIARQAVAIGETDAPGLRQLRHFRQHLAVESDGERTQRVQPRAALLAGTVAQHLDQARLVERRIGVGRATEVRDATGGGGREFALERGLVLEAGFAQARARVDQPRQHPQAPRIDALLGLEACRRRADREDPAVGHMDVSHAVARERSGRAAVHGNALHDRHRFDRLPTDDGDSLHVASMLITAMRTAMPKVTWLRMTERGLSATALSISTPRFIGPGCMTIASGAASASLSVVRP